MYSHMFTLFSNYSVTMLSYLVEGYGLIDNENFQMLLILFLISVCLERSSDSDSVLHKHSRMIVVSIPIYGANNLNDLIN